MIGLGWRGKDFGPSLVVGGDGKVVEVPKGQGLDPGHGPEHDFVVTVRDADHPITRGMPKTWLHPHEQLTHGQHGPARDMTVLTYAYSKDTKRNEVMDWVIPFGKGRVYTTMLGHLWKDGPDTAMRCVGFQTMFIRGVEWAASGEVSYPVPEDFPTDSEIKLRSGGETTAPGPPEGFQAIFNGRDLTGWEGSPTYWTVEDGCLTGTADGTLKYNRFIVWRGGTVKNFELRVKVKVTPGGNSGLQYRGTERPDLGESVVTGYQCDVVANRPDYNGMLYEERGRRILAHTGEKVIIDTEGQPWVVGQFPLKEFQPGEWHEYRVARRGEPSSALDRRPPDGGRHRPGREGPEARRRAGGAGPRRPADDDPVQGLLPEGLARRPAADHRRAGAHPARRPEGRPAGPGQAEEAGCGAGRWGGGPGARR